MLVSRDRHDLAAEAAHLRLVYGVDVEYVAADAAQPEHLVAALRERLGHDSGIRNVLFPVGASRDDDNGHLPPADCARLLAVNLGCVIHVTAAFLPELLQARQGNLVGFGSVAAARGRRTNMVYAAAKRGLASYFESLGLVTDGTGVHTQFYHLGYVATQQSYGKKLLFPTISPERVATFVVNHLNEDISGRYLPGFWWVISRLVRLVPRPVFRRLRF